MTASLASNQIVSHQRRTGRLSNEDREQRTPQGRGLQAVESVVMTISGHALTYRDAAEIRRLHDLEHDRQIARAYQLIETGDLGGALAAIRAAMAADALEDSVADHGDGLVASIHALARKLSGWIERAAVLVRGGR